MNVVKNSAEIMDSVINIGVAKSKMTLGSQLILALLAGAYIGFGGIFALKVAGNLPPDVWGSMVRLIFGLVFPVGLLMVLICGADLFTGDCMFMTGALQHKKIDWAKFLKILTLSLIGNFIGSVILAWLTYKGTILMDGSASGRPMANYAVSVANGKCALTFGVAFYRGILCNWLVCLAIYLSLSSTDGISKGVLMWPPIWCFVATGMEHSVANMTFVPLGIFIGTDPTYLATTGAVALTASWKGLVVTNLIPVVLGNYVGGALFVAMFYYWANNLKAKRGEVKA
ncbi:MAG: formate/nitrite transporter family protein [Deltaproteobacteria bacterium]|jgi:formate/nitrite transporter|nr:formate/nitrite transporter family protein [Deltaproteobacteria bacterium]